MKEWTEEEKEKERYIIPLVVRKIRGGVFKCGGGSFKRRRLVGSLHSTLKMAYIETTSGPPVAHHRSVFQALHYGPR